LAESVIVRQNSSFEIEILARDPHNPQDDRFHAVDAVHHLTPYGMLLSGLGSCTAIVLHTYAQHHDVNLREVELHLTYDRVFADDCVECEDIQEYREQIDEQIVLTGDLTPQERRKLFSVSKHCPIHKMLIQGIEVRSRLRE
jgi:putative redox protein